MDRQMRQRGDFNSVNPPTVGVEHYESTEGTQDLVLGSHWGLSGGDGGQRNQEGLDQEKSMFSTFSMCGLRSGNSQEINLVSYCILGPREQGSQGGYPDLGLWKRCLLWDRMEEEQLCGADICYEQVKWVWVCCGMFKRSCPVGSWYVGLELLSCPRW